MVAERVYDNLPFGFPEYHPPQRLQAKLKEMIRWDLLPEVDSGRPALVRVRFHTDSLGYIREPSILRSFHPAYDLEALRVVRALGKWLIYYHRDHPDYQYFTISVNFDVSPD